MTRRSVPFSAGRLFAVAWKELLQLRRDRMTLGMMVGLPLLQLLLFGYAINTDVRHIPLAVFDQDRTMASRDLVSTLVATSYFDVAGEVGTFAEIEEAMRRGAVKAALVVPERYQADLLAARATSVQLVVDGSDPQSVASAVATASSVLAARSAALSLRGLGPAGSIGAPASLEPVTWFNPDLRTAVFIVPGLLGVILTMTMVMITAMALVRERERGTLEQLIVSPIKRSELVLGKIAPYILLGYLQISIILLAGWAIFDVPVVGSIPLLYLLSLAFVAANLGLGLLFSTLAATQQQAMQMAFFFFLPNVLLSGFMFPYEAMPAAARYLSEALPLTHYLRMVRGIVLKGSEVKDLLPDLYALLGLLSVLLGVSTLRVGKKLG